ncbi:MAG: hypothetical protein JW791_01870 [Nanoarchaeota archaeon]|nr:hypothetical protein [Nanoarchaeota archaeon]
MKKCENTNCSNNINGFCQKNISSGRTVYETLNSYQWSVLRKRMLEKSRKNFKPNKQCRNTDCVNNINRECYLLSEMEVLSIIL